jgi:putative redox protein
MAKNVSVTWLQKKQFVGIGGSQRSVVMSGQDEENAIGVSPSEMLLLGLAGCSAYDVVGILEKKKATLTGLEVKVSGEQQADPPWPYRHIHLEYILRGKGLTDKNVGDAIHLSETKYCSVAATIRPTAEITTSYQIIEDE